MDFRHCQECGKQETPCPPHCFKCKKTFIDMRYVCKKCLKNETKRLNIKIKRRHSLYFCDNDCYKEYEYLVMYNHSNDYYCNYIKSLKELAEN